MLHVDVLVLAFVLVSISKKVKDHHLIFLWTSRSPRKEKNAFIREEDLQSSRNLDPVLFQRKRLRINGWRAERVLFLFDEKFVGHVSRRRTSEMCLTQPAVRYLRRILQRKKKKE